nr:hypothetical protein Iba_chr10eCG4650 [Ipomoea batatas]
MAAPTVAVKDSWTTAAVAVDNSSCPRTPDSWTTMPDDTRFMDKELSTYVAAETGEMERNFKQLALVVELKAQYVLKIGRQLGKGHKPDTK